MSARYTERMRLAQAWGLARAPAGLFCTVPRYRGGGATCGRTAVYVVTDTGQAICAHHHARLRAKVTR